MRYIKVKRSFVVIFLLTLLLSGCNFDTQPKSTEVTTSTQPVTTNQVTTTQMTTTIPDSSITTTPLPTFSTSTTATTTAEYFIVNFVSDSEASVPNQQVLKGTGVEEPTATKTGYRLEGWYTSLDGGQSLDEAWIFASGVVHSNLTLYAKWVINQYTISFDSNEGSSVDSITQDYETPVSEPNDPTRMGHTFIGWYSDRDLTTEYSFTTMSAGNMTLYAKWQIDQFTISFDSNGGSSVDSITQDFDTPVSRPNDPTITGYTCVGWYLDEELTIEYTFTTMPADDILLYAKWAIDHYDIIYVLDGGTSEPNPSSYTIESASITLSNPTKEGHTFGGWYDNAEFTGDSITQITAGITGHITLHAKWTINQYTFSFDSNGGSSVDSITQDFDTPVSRPNDPTITGYTCVGWYLDEELTTEYTFTTMPADDILLYAKWAIDHYDIIYVLDGGTSEPNPSSYTIETATITLSNPTKEGHTFGGWYDNAEFIGDSITQITAGITGHITLHAKWTINQYTIIYGYVSDDYDSLQDIPLFLGETIIQVSLGDAHSSAITSEGRIFIWGRNEYGQLGDGTTSDKSIFFEITDQFNLMDGEMITQGSLGGMHSAVVTSEGRIFIWGRNHYGQLGDGTGIDQSNPTDISDQFNLMDGETIIQVSLGYYHSSAITSEGRIFTWGYNDRGRLGDGTIIDRSTPTDITHQFNLMDGETIIQVSLGGQHSSAITSEGRIFFWGYNGSGNIGDGTYLSRSTPTDITHQFTLNEDEIIIELSLGWLHSSATTSEGRIYIWGYNHSGQLGIGNYSSITTPSDITQRFNLIVGETIASVSLGRDHSSVITSEGRVFTWGSNNYGQLGDGTFLYKLIPTDTTQQFNLMDGETMIRVSLGEYHSSAITSEGRIFTWGNNDYGRLGDGSTTIRNTPVSLDLYIPEQDRIETFTYQDDITYTPTREGYALDGWYRDINLTTPMTFTTMPAEDITLYAKWDVVTYDITYVMDGGTNGSNPSGYTIETSTITLSDPIKEGHTFGGWYDHSDFTGDSITQILLGTTGPINLHAKWTINQYTVHYGIVTDDYDPLQDIPLDLGETIIQVSFGSDHSSAITSEGRIFTWGYNIYGQLGDGTQAFKSTPTDITHQFSLTAGEKIIQVTLGIAHSSAITSEGRLFTWGWNNFGQLGDGTTANRTTPTDITHQFNLNIGEKIIQASLGHGHSSVITSEGRIFIWGWNNDGQLGDGTSSNRLKPTHITPRFYLPAGETIIQVSLNMNHSSAITSEGRIFTWGHNIFGQLGDGTTSNRTKPTDITHQFNLNIGETIIQVSLGWNHTSAITSEGRIFTWGNPASGQLGSNPIGDNRIPNDITSSFGLSAGETIIQVEFGGNHSSVITSEGRVFTWGSNNYGQLGDGTTSNRTIPTDITDQFDLMDGETIIQVEFGGSHSSVITSEDRIFTWGLNNYGQLGDGTTSNRSTPEELGFYTPEPDSITTHTYDDILDDYIPFREGYIFDGWYLDVDLTIAFTLTTMPAEDILLYGKWVEA